VVRKHVLASSGLNEEQKFEIAESYLRDYAQAKLVITSRIHCALPCLAMGVPVIFINGFDDPVDSCRFGGILELLNHVDIGPSGAPCNNFGHFGLIDGTYVPENPLRHLETAVGLRRECEAFIATG
jgi:hypothetical protein